MKDEVFETLYEAGRNSMVVNSRAQQFHWVCCKTGSGNEPKQAVLCWLGSLIDEENLPDHIPFSVTSARAYCCSPTRKC